MSTHRTSHFVRRLTRMGWREVRTRARQATAKRTDAWLHRLGIDAYRGASVLSTCPGGRFFCDARDVESISDMLRSAPDGGAQIINDAERILTRNFDLLGYRNLRFGEEPDWSLDPVHGKRTSMRPWHAIDFLDFAQAGDHKVVWELNRHQFLVTLARAYRITRDPRFAAALKDLWYDWQRKNPYPLGVNWASALEVAFRASSWTWAAFLLEGTGEDSSGFQHDVAAAACRSAWYIRRYLSTYFAPNTHLLGEGAALFLIGTRYPALPGAGEWRSSGWKIVLDECARQVRTDGLHFEQSIYYHVYALDFFLHTRCLAARNGVDIPGSLDSAIYKMSSALAALSQAGALPRFGDDDGGRVFDARRNLSAHLLDPLSTAAVLFHDSGFQAASPGLVEETLWLLGPQCKTVFDSLTAAAPKLSSVALPQCGIYAMTSPERPVRQLFIDAGEQGALTAGHGHADALSLQLASGGRLWLTDPGTFCYVGNGRVREAFRGTAAHNTMTVDGLDQAQPAGPFSWGPRPQVAARQWASSEEFDLFEGSHSGYERLGEPVTHRRWVVRLGAGLWLVRDLAEGHGTHQLDLRWHFAPDLDVSARGPALVASCGGEEMMLLPVQAEPWELSLEAGEFSPVYGVKVPAPVAAWSARTACPAEFAIVIGFAPKLPPPSLTRRIAAGATGYECSWNDVRYRVFFAERGRSWVCGEWASDAAVLCLAVQKEGSVRGFFSEGSYVEHMGQRVIESGGPARYLVFGEQDGIWSAGPSGESLPSLSLP